MDNAINPYTVGLETTATLAARLVELGGIFATSEPTQAMSDEVKFITDELERRTNDAALGLTTKGNE